MLQERPNRPALSCLRGPVQSSLSNPVVYEVGINSLVEVILDFLAPTFGSRPVKRCDRESRCLGLGRRIGLGAIPQMDRGRLRRVLRIRCRKTGRCSEPLGSRVGTK